MSNLEQTLSIIKPDAVERNLENEIKYSYSKDDTYFDISSNIYQNLRNKHFFNVYCTFPIKPKNASI